MFFNYLRRSASTSVIKFCLCKMCSYQTKRYFFIKNLELVCIRWIFIEFKEIDELINICLPIRIWYAFHIILGKIVDLNEFFNFKSDEVLDLYYSAFVAVHTLSLSDLESIAIFKEMIKIQQAFNCSDEHLINKINLTLFSLRNSYCVSTIITQYI